MKQNTLYPSGAFNVSETLSAFGASQWPCKVDGALLWGPVSPRSWQGIQMFTCWPRVTVCLMQSRDAIPGRWLSRFTTLFLDPCISSCFWCLLYHKVSRHLIWSQFLFLFFLNLGNYLGPILTLFFLPKKCIFRWNCGKGYCQLHTGTYVHIYVFICIYICSCMWI